MIRVLVNGAQGKMGSMAARFIADDQALTLVGETDRSDDLARSIQDTQADVVVDLTTASAGYNNFLTIVKAGAHPVVGTSGFTREHIATLQETCHRAQRGALIAPNFALGAVLMMRFAREAARFMTDVEIIESHHPQKADSPSGTAIRTAEDIAAARGEVALATDHHRPSEELVSGVRGGRVQGVPIHSMRLLGILAQQRVTFGMTGQTLVLEHTSISRESFMDGICLACRRIVGTRILFDGLDSLLFNNPAQV